MDDTRRKAQNHVTYEVAKAKFLNPILSKGLISQDEYGRAERYLYEHLRMVGAGEGPAGQVPRG
jgi:hypothetical protein